MADRTATAVWEGSLQDGKGRTNFDSSNLGTFDVSWPNRNAEDASGQTSPEELLAAAHASCFSMAMSKQLEDRGGPPDRLETTVTVTFRAGTISNIVIRVRGSAPAVDADGFREAAAAAKDGCPVSKLFAGGSAEIALEVAT